jgi:hypothetical protein
MKIDKNLYIGKSQDELSECLVEACKDGDLDLVKFLLNDNELPLKAELYYITDKMEFANSLLAACANGRLNIVEYLCLSEDLKDKTRPSNEIEAALSVAAAYGYLDIVKFFLTNKNVEYIDIYKNSNAFVSACGSGQLDIVKYLISSPEIKKHIDPNKYVSGFKKACTNNYVNIAQFFLEDTDLLQELTPADYKDIFANVCYYNAVNALNYLLENTYIDEHADTTKHFIRAIDNKNIEMIQYFIFDYTIEKNSKIEEYIKDNTEIQNWFKSRDLKKDLDNELICKADNKKVRIKL